MLLSDASGFVAGQIPPVNGGFVFNRRNIGERLTARSGYSAASAFSSARVSQPCSEMSKTTPLGSLYLTSA